MLEFVKNCINDVLFIEASQMYSLDRKAFIVKDKNYSIHRILLHDEEFLKARKEELDTFISDELNKGYKIIKIVFVTVNLNKNSVVFYSFDSELFTHINNSNIYGKNNKKFENLKKENELSFSKKHFETVKVYKTSLSYKNYSTYLQAVDDFDELIHSI